LSNIAIQSSSSRLLGGINHSEDFRQAYVEARNFGKALAKGGKCSGFMKNLMEQRICSSIVAGLNTARMLLEGRTVQEENDEQMISATIFLSVSLSILTLSPF
jgi:uncharacterized protein YerC